MAQIGRLNNIIKAWEEGRPAFSSFAQPNKYAAIDFSTAPYDGVIFEMEHNPWDVENLQDALQYLLNRKQIASSGSLAPAVTPAPRKNWRRLVGEEDPSELAIIAVSPRSQSAVGTLRPFGPSRS